jgi:sensor histidine kinase YesM
MNTGNRFRFWRTFWIVTAIYIVFGIIGIIGMFVTPMTNTQPNWEKVFGWKHLLEQLISLIFFSCFYYFSLNAYYKVIAARKPFVNYLKPTILSLLIVGIYYTISFFFLDKGKVEISVNSKQMMAPERTIPVFIFAYIISSIFIIGFSLLLSYLTYLRDERKQRKILEEQKMQLEVEKSTANFNFLKAQINPHFLHNTLNFLYAKSLPYSQELSEGILTLSDIMRYALSEGNARDGKAPLKDEIEHVRNVIKINQLRFSNNLNVHFDVEGVVNGATIIPFVLITLVENAFKHGDLKDTQHPIDVKLKVDGKQLIFYCRNKKKTGPKEISTGIGLDNIKKRLDLAYGKDYALNVKDEAEFYTTELIINNL